jgi:hypothetical protein
MSMPVIRLRQSVQFPAQVYGANGIDVTKVNGNYTIENNWSDFSVTNAIPSSPTNYVLTYDTLTGVYVLVPSILIGSGGGSSVGLVRIITDSANVNVGTADGVIAFNQITPTAVSVFLPSATARAGIPLSVEDYGGVAGSHNITIVPFASETIDGRANVTIVNNHGFVSLRPYSSLAGWKIINGA